MAVALAVGESLVSPEQLDRAAGDKQFDSFLKADFNPGFDLTIDDTTTLTGTDLRQTHEANSVSIPFQGIGLGKPLTVVLEQVYLGNYLDTVPWIPGNQRGDVLVTSAHKSFQTFQAAPRAVHLMQKRAPRKAMLRAKATREGSQLVFYSPAITDDSVIFTFEIAVDRDFDEAFGKSLSQAFKTAGALPVFAPAAPYLVAAGVAIPLASRAENLLARPRTWFDATVNLNFARPGLKTFQAGAFLVYPDGSESEFKDYTVSMDDHSLQDKNGRRYSGDSAYIVVSLDGTEQPEYEKWTAQAATAALTERFFGGEGSLTKALELVAEGLTLYNDLDNQQRALKMRKRLASTTDAEEKARLEVLYEAYKKHIQSDEIRKTLK